MADSRYEGRGESPLNEGGKLGVGGENNWNEWIGVGVGAFKSGQSNLRQRRGGNGMGFAQQYSVVGSVACQCGRDAVKDSAVCRTGEEVMAWPDKTRRLEGAIVTCMLELPCGKNLLKKTGRGIKPICSASASASCKGRSRDQGKDQGTRLERVRSHSSPGRRSARALFLLSLSPSFYYRPTQNCARLSHQY